MPFAWVSPICPSLGVFNFLFHKKFLFVTLFVCMFASFMYVRVLALRKGNFTETFVL